MGTGQVFEQKCRNKCIRLVFFFLQNEKSLINHCASPSQFCIALIFSLELITL